MSIWRAQVGDQLSGCLVTLRPLYVKMELEGPINFFSGHAGGGLWEL